MQLKKGIVKYGCIFLFTLAVIFGFGRKNRFDHSPISPTTYLATLTFDGSDGLSSGETNFPLAFSFNVTQDANGDGKMDVEDNLENLVLYSIGDSISGKGKTGLVSRGPNDQRPAVYFHYDTVGVYEVYEYWLYYADNDWLNNHEHDWEKYFVYVQDGWPKFIKLSHHNDFTTYPFEFVANEGNHAIVGVHRGSHAMNVLVGDGVKIQYDGKVAARNGKLLQGNNKQFPWRIYSNDKNVEGAIPFSQATTIFFYGDPSYLENRNELGDPRKAPWERTEWESPPLP